MFRKSLCFLVLVIVSAHSFAGVFDAVRDLAKRRVPWLEPHLSFEKISSGKEGQDRFTLSSEAGKIIIAASDVNAAAEGLNWYLQYYCHRSMSHLGDNLSAVSPLPLMKQKVTKSSPFRYRYALNYCTLNYTMSFYDWKDWQRELDWMALHGVNLMLMPIGTEAVWQQTMRKFGFSEKEIEAFIPGPAFNAWWLMSNLEGWGGPVTQRMIDRRTGLEQKILARMHGLGIEPVLQGFYGMVPRALKKHYPHAHILDQGKWAGDFVRPDFLLPDDPLFHQMAAVYYGEIKTLYGKDIRFFGGDPFHEGGITKGVDLTAAGKSIQQDMRQAFPASTWILQGWQENPRKALLAGLDKSKVLVLELAGERSNDWEKRKGFDGTPFIWCTANNFGGRSGLYGKLQFFADEVNRILTGPYNTLCKGIGIMPEGINNNPVDYDLMLELGWHRRKLKVDDWIKKYVLYRYGKENDSIREAWKILLRTVYSSPEGQDPGLPEDLLCARPSEDVKSASTWGNIKRDYDPALFARGVRAFLAAYPVMKDCDCYRVDAIDFTRQALANQGENIYHQAEKAFEGRDSSDFKKYSIKFVHLLLLDDSLLSMDEHFRLRRWLEVAEALAKTAYERRLFERDAREQITIWGPDTNPDTNLHDYANREWSGLISTFYLPRWQLFFRQQLKQLRGEQARRIDYFSFEKRWSLETNMPPRVYVHDSARLFTAAKEAF
jgi:alpha-N-acetylglucosaminidase